MDDGPTLVDINNQAKLGHLYPPGSLWSVAHYSFGPAVWLPLVVTTTQRLSA